LSVTEKGDLREGVLIWEAWIDGYRKIAGKSRSRRKITLIIYDGSKNIANKSRKVP
jgi:hypothetical protein